MRIYIAIRANQQIREDYKKIKVEVLQQLSINWTLEENLHMTLIPPWTTTTPDSVYELLNSKIKIKPFTVNFHKIVAGPNLNTPRLIWAYSRPNKDLSKLHNRLSELLNPYLQEKQTKRLIPHITLAKATSETDINRLKSVYLPCSWSLDVENIEILESTTENYMRVYKTLYTISLLK